MNGSAKQITWATEILSTFAGTSDKDAFSAAKRISGEELAAAGITTRDDIIAMRSTCDARIRAESAGWIINNRTQLGYIAFCDALNISHF